eukprot:1153022-Pelagomonas_calceolata.AAC.2
MAQRHDKLPGITETHLETMVHMLASTGKPCLHHHTHTCTDGNTPSQQEGSQEAVLQGAGEQHGLDGVEQAEVQAAVHDDAHAGDGKAAVQTGDTVGGQGLPVHVDETVELALSALLGALAVVGQAGTGIVQGVNEGQGAGASQATGGHVTCDGGCMGKLMGRGFQRFGALTHHPARCAGGGG